MKKILSVFLCLLCLLLFSCGESGIVSDGTQGENPSADLSSDASISPESTDDNFSTAADSSDIVAGATADTSGTESDGTSALENAEITPWKIPIENTADLEGAVFNGVFGVEFEFDNGTPIIKERSGCFDCLSFMLKNDGFDFSVYQAVSFAQGGFYTQIEDAAYRVYDEQKFPAEDVKENLNKLFEVYINGERVSLASLEIGGGNGHKDYRIRFDKSFSREEILTYRISTDSSALLSTENSIYTVYDAETFSYDDVVEYIRGQALYTELKVSEFDNFTVFYGAQTGTPHGTIYQLNVIGRDGRCCELLSGLKYPNIYCTNVAADNITVSEDLSVLRFSRTFENKTYFYEFNIGTGVLTESEKESG